VRYAAAISIILATLSLGLGYAMGRLWAGAALSVALGVLWLLGRRRGRGWAASVGMTCFVGTAALGIWWQLSAPAMLVGSVAALAAWDLDHFTERMRSTDHVVGQDGMVRSHLRRLLIVSGIGLLLGGVALGVQIELSFGWALLLGASAILGLSRARGFARRADGE
jgi:hypothetical protein